MKYVANPPGAALTSDWAMLSGRKGTGGATVCTTAVRTMTPAAPTNPAAAPARTPEIVRSSLIMCAPAWEYGQDRVGDGFSGWPLCAFWPIDPDGLRSVRWEDVR